MTTAETTAESTGPDAPARPARPLLAGWGVVGWAAIVLAAAFLAWAAWPGGDGGKDGPARDRDTVLRTARQQIATLNTMDRANADAGLRAWLGASTGPLHDQLRRDEPQSRAKIQKARTSAAGTVTDAAVLSLDTATGRAKVIAAVRVRLTPETGAPSDQRKRFEAGLSRTPDGWKLESLTAIPAGAR